MYQIFRPKSNKKAKEVIAFTLEEEKLLINKLISNKNKVYSLIFLMQLENIVRYCEIPSNTVR